MMYKLQLSVSHSVIWLFVGEMQRWRTSISAVAQGIQKGTLDVWRSNPLYKCHYTCVCSVGPLLLLCFSFLDYPQERDACRKIQRFWRTARQTSPHHTTENGKVWNEYMGLCLNFYFCAANMTDRPTAWLMHLCIIMFDSYVHMLTVTFIQQVCVHTVLILYGYYYVQRHFTDIHTQWRLQDSWTTQAWL